LQNKDVYFKASCPTQGKKLSGDYNRLEIIGIILALNNLQNLDKNKWKNVFSFQF
jgi:hypothetical protein